MWKWRTFFSNMVLLPNRGALEEWWVFFSEGHICYEIFMVMVILMVMLILLVMAIVMVMVIMTDMISRQDLVNCTRPAKIPMPKNSFNYQCAKFPPRGFTRSCPLYFMINSCKKSTGCYKHCPSKVDFFTFFQAKFQISNLIFYLFEATFWILDFKFSLFEVTFWILYFEFKILLV